MHLRLRVMVATATSGFLLTWAAPSAQTPGGAPEITFAKQVAPILQRSCQECHHTEGVAPMALVTYEDVRPWAKAIKTRTALRSQRGAMPPFFVEKNIGIQKFKHDPSLSEDEIATIAKWADSGAPRGNPADMPAPLHFDDSDKWTIGEPDLILKSKEVLVPAAGPDWWGDVGLIPTGLTEDRYVSAVEVRELNDIPRGGDTKTVGGRYVFHHMTYSSVKMGERGPATSWRSSWPIHEVGRNADIFPPEAGPPAAGELRAVARRGPHPLERPRDEGASRVRVQVVSEGLQADLQAIGLAPRQRHRHRREAEPGEPGTPRLRDAAGAHEDHRVRAAPARAGRAHVPRGDLGHNIQTLNCVGYDHNWVKQYVYDDDAAPLLPKGTIVHLIGFLDTTAANKNPADPRNWAGGGRRSIANMFIDLGYSVSLNEEQFQAEMAKRRAKMKNRNDYDIGCPLCWAPPVPTATTSTAPGSSRDKNFNSTSRPFRAAACGLKAALR